MALVSLLSMVEWLRALTAMSLIRTATTPTCLRSRGWATSNLADSYFRGRDTLAISIRRLSSRGAHDEYVLVSPARDIARIYWGPLNTPRQLARYLVAHTVGTIGLASWRENPNREKALAICAELRSLPWPT